jgi:anti-sigma regulatory factor (Ser/Thr protein kinase)
MRERVRVWLGRQHVGAQHSEDVTLACSEAAANALEHAYRDGPGPVFVEGERNGDELSIRVRDAGRWRTPRDSERGRGLRVVDELMDRVEIVKAESGTELRMTRRLLG